MASNKFDPQPPDRDTPEAAAPANIGQPVPGADGEPQVIEIDFLALIGRAGDISREYQSKTIEKPLSRSYRAWNNQHSIDSKYLGTAFKGRSRLFVPKTKTAVRKNLATTAGALFSNESVVNVSATFEDDPQQRAVAATIGANLDYRLTCNNSINGVPWFLIALGASLDAQLTGVAISKQFWDFKEVPTGRVLVEQQLMPQFDEDGNEIYQLVDDGAGGFLIDPETGEAVIEQVHALQDVKVPEKIIVHDRPMIELYPIENADVDPAAPWYAPVQLGRWFSMRHPIGLDDCEAMLKQPSKNGNFKWIEQPREVLLKGRNTEDKVGARRVREGGSSDRYQDGAGTDKLDIIWIQENFIRIGGLDYHFWSVGKHAYLSEPTPVYQVYPEFGGERCYTMGVAALDTHRVFPMSPVESWQPLQLEINDITNLRQDTLKRAIAPLVLVKRGANVDRSALANRGKPEVVLEADKPGEDVVFQNTPAPSGAAYTETAITNSSFDELAGVFSTSSVQSNRQLNETVGGMRIMTGAANAVSEFDLRIFIETWVEPVLRQVMHLIRFNESDERLVAIAGAKARVEKKYGYMPTLSDFEQADVTLRVNAGVGALDPMQVLSKLKMGMDMLAPLFPVMKEQGIMPNMEEIIEEVFGRAGFKDGRRFFTFGNAPPEAPEDPKVTALLKKLEQEREAMMIEFKSNMAELASKERMNTQDNATLVHIAEMKGEQQTTQQMLGAATQHASQERGFAHDKETQSVNADNDRKKRITDALIKARDKDRADAAKGSGTGGGGSGGGHGLDHTQIMDSIETMLTKFGKQFVERIAPLEEAVAVLTKNMLPKAAGGTPPAAGGGQPLPPMPPPPSPPGGGPGAGPGGAPGGRRSTVG
jgi:hypothetical protein